MQLNYHMLTLQKYNLKGHLTGRGGRPVCPQRGRAEQRFPSAILPQLVSNSALSVNQPTLHEVLRPPFQSPIFLKLLTLAVISSR